MLWKGIQTIFIQIFFKSICTIKAFLTTSWYQCLAQGHTGSSSITSLSFFSAVFVCIFNVLVSHRLYHSQVWLHSPRSEWTVLKISLSNSLSETDKPCKRIQLSPKSESALSGRRLSLHCSKNKSARLTHGARSKKTGFIS